VWLAACGADVLRIRCDASNDLDVCAVVHALCGDGSRLNGVFHAAHQLADAVVITTGGVWSGTGPSGSCPEGFARKTKGHKIKKNAPKAAKDFSLLSSVTL